MEIPRVVIASPHSGAGKTTVAIGLMNAFATAGLRVQPFKVGPDFIDPSYHTAATGVYSKNLDTWLTSPEAVLDNNGNLDTPAEGQSGDVEYRGSVTNALDRIRGHLQSSVSYGMKDLNEFWEKILPIFLKYFSFFRITTEFAVNSHIISANQS